MFQRQFPGTLKKFHVLWIRTGPSTLDEIDTQLIQFQSDADFVVARK
jgi:hypothetical protein